MASLQDANSPVASRATNCALLFDQLTRLSKHIDQVSKSQALDEFSRFKLWAGNIGALHPFSIKTSLDFRLRENSRVSKRITDLLDELAESLEEAYSITSGITEGHTAESALADQDELVFDEDNEGLSEISEIFTAISDVTVNLFRISSVIRNNIGRDRYAKAIASAALRFPVNDDYDIGHVQLKFPALRSGSKDWLAVRLGKAITHRRQYLWYCREHHDKTVNELKSPVHITQELPTDKPERKSAVDGKSIRSKHPSTLAQTQASTLLLADDASLSGDHLDEENCSQLSYATSITEGSGDHKLSVVPLATVSQGRADFECPYCWRVIHIKSQMSWKSHVLSDLRPYICTFEECKVSKECDVILFPNRSTWWAHELQMHRRQWSCTFCPKGKVFNSATGFESHLRSQHAMTLGGDFDAQLPRVLEMCQHSLSHKIRPECLFCENWEQDVREQNPQFSQTEAFYITPKQYKSHVGAHMEQLALFAIPRGAVDDGRSQSKASVGENYQARSLQSLGESNPRLPSPTSTDDQQEKDLNENDDRSQSKESAGESLQRLAEWLSATNSQKKDLNDNGRLDNGRLKYSVGEAQKDPLSRPQLHSEGYLHGQQSMEAFAQTHKSKPNAPVTSQQAADRNREVSIDLEAALESAINSNSESSEPSTSQDDSQRQSAPVRRRSGLPLPITASRPLATSLPIFPCTFSFAGCPSTFKSKNEWKRHVASKHTCFYFWECRVNSCSHPGQSSRFNRKDLYRQHLIRIHTAPSASLSGENSTAKEEWAANIDNLVEEGKRAGRRLIRKIGCPVPGCGERWEGGRAWDERMEHVARHWEGKGEGEGYGSWSEQDGGLLEWAIQEGVVRENGEGGWTLEFGDREGGY